MKEVHLFVRIQALVLFHYPGLFIGDGEVFPGRVLVLLTDHIADLLILGLLERRLVRLVAY